MTPVPLQVSPDGVAVLAARCQVLADGFAVTPPVGVTSNWQSSAGAVDKSAGRASKTVAVSAARLRATGANLTAAAAGYESHETDAVRRFSELPQRGPVLA